MSMVEPCIEKWLSKIVLEGDQVVRKAAKDEVWKVREVKFARHLFNVLFA
jgi:hypothetical protein